MLLESLVIYACLSGSCQTASEAYYMQNENFRASVKTLENKVMNRTPKFVQASVPFATILYNKKMTLPLGNSRAISVIMDQSPMVIYEMGF